MTAPRAWLTTLLYLTTLADTRAQHYTCSSPKWKKVELSCSGEVEPWNVSLSCGYSPEWLDVSNCPSGLLPSLQSILPSLTALRFVFASNWRPRQVTFSPYLKGLDISYNGIEELTTSTFSNNENLSYLDLSRNLLTKIEPGVFKALPQLKVLLLSHNKLQSINLECLELTSRLKSLDLSHNQMKLADIGSGIFAHMKEINFSYNKISTFSVSADIKMTFFKLKKLNLSHNEISGVLTRSDLSALRKNVTVDLSYNNIERCDLRYRGIDLVNSRNMDSTTLSTTTFIVHNNSLACDCYAGLMATSEGNIRFDDFLCPDNSPLSEKADWQLVCPVPGYSALGPSSPSCPPACHCTYSIRLTSLTVNCTDRNLTHFPPTNSLQPPHANDSVILLLANNEIQELSQDLTDTNIVHLDLTNNKIKNIDERKLPSKLRRLLLSTNRLETLSVEMMQHLKKSRINFSLSSNPLSCSCERLRLHLSSLHLSEDLQSTFCEFSNIPISRDTTEFLCNGKFYFFAIFSVIFIFIVILVRRLKPRGGRMEFDYDVFISYSHHDAQFAENVLYPGLVNNNVKCCIHTLHWQVTNQHN